MNKSEKPKVSRTCEKLTGETSCGSLAKWAYPTSEGGWMALCEHHAEPHFPHVFQIEDIDPESIKLKRPLKDWPSDLMEHIFWIESEGVVNPVPDTVLEMIHAEMNARGEGERVAV